MSQESELIFLKNLDRMRALYLPEDEDDQGDEAKEAHTIIYREEVIENLDGDTPTPPTPRDQDGDILQDGNPNNSTSSSPRECLASSKTTKLKG